MKFSFHSPIPFLPLFYNSRLSPAPLLPNSYPGRQASRNWSRLYSTEAFFITTSHGSSRKHSFCCWEGLFTSPLHSNGSYSIVAWVFVAAGMCLPSRCLAIKDYPDFAIPAFGRHVTILTRLIRKVMCSCNFVCF
jgi:hypothetical protein